MITFNVPERVKQLEGQGKHAEAAELRRAATALHLAYGEPPLVPTPPAPLAPSTPPPQAIAPTPSTTAPASQPTKPRTMPPMPNAHELTAADLKRVSSAAGIEMPMPASAFAEPVDTKRSQKIADRYVRRMARYQEHERKQRTEAIKAGTIDAATATGEQIAERLRQLGIADAVVETGFNARSTDRLPAGEVADPHGRPPLPKMTAADEKRQREDVQREVDRMVVDRVRTAIRRGERFDAKALTPSQMSLLSEFGYTF